MNKIILSVVVLSSICMSGCFGKRSTKKAIQLENRCIEKVLSGIEFGANYQYDSSKETWKLVDRNPEYLKDRIWIDTTVYCLSYGIRNGSLPRIMDRICYTIFY